MNTSPAAESPMKISEAMKIVRSIMEKHLDPKTTRYIGSLPKQLERAADLWKGR